MGKGESRGSEVEDFGQPIGQNMRDGVQPRRGVTSKTRMRQRQNWPKVRYCLDLAEQ